MLYESIFGLREYGYTCAHMLTWKHLNTQIFTGSFVLVSFFFYLPFFFHHSLSPFITLYISILFYLVPLSLLSSLPFFPVPSISISPSPSLLYLFHVPPPSPTSSLSLSYLFCLSIPPFFFSHFRFSFHFHFFPIPLSKLTPSIHL